MVVDVGTAGLVLPPGTGERFSFLQEVRPEMINAFAIIAMKKIRFIFLGFKVE